MYAEAYRYWDIIIEDFELNIACSMSVEPSVYGVDPWGLWSNLGGGRWVVGQYPSFAPVVGVTAGYLNFRRLTSTKVNVPHL